MPDLTVQAPTATVVNAVVKSGIDRKAGWKALGKSLLRGLLIAIATVVIVLAIWIGVLQIFEVSPMLAKTPVDVFNFLFTVPKAEENREEIFGLLGVTMGNSVIGFVAGLIAALVGAILFRLSATIESTVMPVAMLLRSVPLVAMAPLIILIFGTGSVASVAVIGGIVVLFPALVTITFGLKSAPQEMEDLIHVYGGSSWTATRKIAIPAALPSLFAAIRVSVPGAITGALLAEWLSTGTGIGGAVNGYVAQVKYNDLWASVVVVTATALILYAVTQVIETIVLNRMGMGGRS